MGLDITTDGVVERGVKKASFLADARLLTTLSLSLWLLGEVHLVADTRSKVLNRQKAGVLQNRRDLSLFVFSCMMCGVRRMPEENSKCGPKTALSLNSLYSHAGPPEGPATLKPCFGRGRSYFCDARPLPDL